MSDRPLKSITFPGLGYRYVIPEGGGSTVIIAPDFSASTAYAAGAYVVYNDNLYRFTSAHAAGAWTGNDVTQVTVGGELGTLKSEISAKPDTDLGISGATVGKYAKVKAVDANGKPTEWEAGSGGGGGGGTSDYTDLSNKPSINDVTLAGNKSAADLGLGTYSKPSGGIPKTDLASAVQTSLEKADASTSIDLGLTGATAGKIIKVLTVDANGKPLTWEAVDENPETNVSGSTPTVVAVAGMRYIAGTLTSLDFTPCADGMCSITFTSGATATVLTLPQTGVTMPDGFSVEANKKYELNFLDGMGVAQSWSVATS